MTEKHIFQDTLEETHYIVTSKPRPDEPRLYVEEVTPLMRMDLEERGVVFDEAEGANIGDDDWVGIEVEVGNGNMGVEFFPNLEDAVYVIKHIQESYDEEPDLREILGDDDFPFRVERVKPTVAVDVVSDSDLLIADLEADIDGLSLFDLNADAWGNGTWAEDETGEYDETDDYSGYAGPISEILDKLTKRAREQEAELRRKAEEDEADE